MLNPATTDCYEKAQAKVGRPTSHEMVNEFGEFLFTCMASFQVAQHLDDVVEVTQCIGEFSPDEAQMKRSFIK